jgi:hypothetical protein
VVAGEKEEMEVCVDADEGESGEEEEEEEEEDIPIVGPAEKGVPVSLLNCATSTVFTDSERRVGRFALENRVCSACSALFSSGAAGEVMLPSVGCRAADTDTSDRLVAVGVDEGIVVVDRGVKTCAWADAIV